MESETGDSVPNGMVEDETSRELVPTLGGLQDDQAPEGQVPVVKLEVSIGLVLEKCIELYILCSFFTSLRLMSLNKSYATF